MTQVSGRGQDKADYEVPGKYNVRVQALTEGLFRLSFSKTVSFKEPLLNRYKLLKEDWPPLDSEIRTGNDTAIIKAGKHSLLIDKRTGMLQISGEKDLLLNPEPKAQGFSLSIPLSSEERLFGLGDECREGMMKRGKKAVIWVQNVKSYIPIPFLLSSRGWGILVNTTFRHFYDLGADEPESIAIEASDGPFDIYLFLASAFHGLIDLYTQLTGRPLLLPRYAYGYTFICNEENDARAMLDDAHQFRDSEIPCDCIGLEPGWMETFYDLSVNKKWDPEKFYIPYWIRETTRHHRLTFFGALHRLGFRLSLWICCDYDLLWEEEKKTAVTKKNSWDSKCEIADIHLTGEKRLDKYTVHGQAWFEHLKQFVDQGVSAFKLDAAYFVNDHPDRVWADQYLDKEVHNLLPLVYGRQMSCGYSGYTGERAMINIPMGYAGIQHYCASWTGDTGGGLKPLLAMLNLGFCGVSNITCDMRVTEIEGIHFGFLQAWAQQNNWNYWLQPWFLGNDLEQAFSFYARLRSQLFPYIYSYAHVAAATGMPMMRSMTLNWPETDKYDEVFNQYMLGEALLVTVFCDQAVLPDGIWYDFWTDERLEGGGTINYKPPEGRGGGLFVRAGSIIPMQPWTPALEKFHPENIDLHFYPGGNAGIDLVEDDGITNQYLEGQRAITPVSVSLINENTYELLIGCRTGDFKGMGPVTSFRVIFHGEGKPLVTGQDGKDIELEYSEAYWSFFIPAEQHRSGELRFICRFRPIAPEQVKPQG